MPAGRPHELTPDIIAEVRDALPRVLYVETVADMIGVHAKTLQRWIKAGGAERRRRARGKPPDPARDLHCELVGAVDKALAEQQGNYLGSMKAVGEARSWQALAWILERRWPGQWSAHRKDIRELARAAGDQERRLRELEVRLGDAARPAPDPPPPRCLPPGPTPNVGGDADPDAV